MTCNLVTSLRAPFQSAHGELMAESVDPRPVRSGLRMKCDEPEEEVERPVDHRVRERLASRRDEDVVIRSPHGTPLFQIAGQGGSGRRVQRHESTLAELRLADEQPIPHHVVEDQLPRFGDAQPGGRQQPEQGVVGQWPPRSFGPEAGGRLEQLLQLSR